MKKQISIQPAGFTLVELVLVISIFGILFSVVSSTFLNAMRAATKAQAALEVRQNGEAALSRMIHEIKGATRVVGCPTGATGNSRVRIVDPLSGKIVRYRSRNGAITRTLGTGTEENITDVRSVRVVPLSMVFTCVDLGGPGERVDISFELEYVPFGTVSLIANAQSQERIKILFRTSVVNRNVN